MIKIEELRQILEMAREHDLTELELESEGQRLRIRKESNRPAPPAVSTVPAALAPLPIASAPSALAPAPADLDSDSELAVVKSPIVGTFYCSPAPNAPAFVEPGDAVHKGQTLCIIEAMKMMNNIDCEYEGVVVKVFVENGQAVQYGERLFAIRTA